ncbi:MAG: NUDIX domain-containing protein, partial [Acidimicrobiia bacterium]
MVESAGILLYRLRGESVEVLLGHPGGPFWRNREEGAWSIPKGEIDQNEDGESAARREFREETGQGVDGELVALGSVIQRGGKIVHGWAGEGDADVGSLESNTFDLEWPPSSGTVRS